MSRKYLATVLFFPIKISFIISFLPGIPLITNVIALDKSNCPSACVCTGTTIQCTDELLSSVPDFKKITIHPTTIDLSINDIEEVKMVHFYSKKLETVQSLFLNDNSVYLVEASAFATLQNLEHLDLSNNLLEDISYDVIKNNQKLTKLNLSGNLFGSKAPKLVSSSLKILDLSVSKITIFTEDNLRGLPNLEVLDLFANNLKYIDYDIFFRTNLQKVDLYFNPWKCNCDTIKLFNYLASNNMTEIDKAVQCMHDNKWFQDIYYKNGPQIDLCKSEIGENIVHSNSNSTKSIDSSPSDTNNQNTMYGINTDINDTEDVIQNEFVIITVIGVTILMLVLISLASLIVIVRRLRVQKHTYAKVNYSFVSV